MSYISLIVPAFHLNTVDKNEINKYCCFQFKTSEDNFNLVEIKNENLDEIINYGIIFNKSILSLQAIEQLIYERNCMQNLSENIFESLQLISKKLNNLENLINSIKVKSQNFEKEEEKNNNYIENIKEKEKQKIKYTEISLKKIKFEYKNIFEEIEAMNLKTNNKKIFPKEIVDNLKIDRGLKYENKEKQTLYE